MISCWTPRALGRICAGPSPAIETSGEKRPTPPSSRRSLGHGGIAGDSGGKLRKKTWERYGTVVLEQILWEIWEGRIFFQWCVGGWNPNHTLPEFCCQDDDFGAPKAHEFDRCNLDVLPLSWCSTWRCLIAMSLARGWQQLRIFGILQIPNFCRTGYLIGCQSESLDLSRSLTKPGNG